MIQIHIPKFSALHRETHLHRCRLCNPKQPDRAYKMEPNTICGKTLRGTGLEWHWFACAVHMADYRERFGIDTLIDAFIDLEQAARFAHEWPDDHIEERERTETNNTDMADYLKRKDSI